MCYWILIISLIQEKQKAQSENSISMLILVKDGRKDFAN